MNKINLVRKVNFDGEKDVVTYEVIRVVGAVSPYVGEILSLDHVRDLCAASGTWTVTFIKDSTK